jgi:hypothetical protein
MSTVDQVGVGARYSRRICIEHTCDLQPGDLVDISTTLDPCWASVELVGVCADDRDEDVDCDGNCEAVIFFANSEELDAPSWHVSGEIYARLLADATQDDTSRGADAALTAAGWLVGVDGDYCPDHDPSGDAAAHDTAAQVTS